MPEMGRREAVPHAADAFTAGQCNKEVTSKLLYMISAERKLLQFSKLSVDGRAFKPAVRQFE